MRNWNCTQQHFLKALLKNRMDFKGANHRSSTQGSPKTLLHRWLSIWIVLLCIPVYRLWLITCMSVGIHIYLPVYCIYYVPPCERRWQSVHECMHFCIWMSARLSACLSACASTREVRLKVARGKSIDRPLRRMQRRETHLRHCRGNFTKQNRPEYSVEWNDL